MKKKIFTANANNMLSNEEINWLNQFQNKKIKIIRINDFYNIFRNGGRYHRQLNNEHIDYLIQNNICTHFIKSHLTNAKFIPKLPIIDVEIGEKNGNKLSNVVVYYRTFAVRVDQMTVEEYNEIKILI